MCPLRFLAPALFNKKNKLGDFVFVDLQHTMVCTQRGKGQLGRKAALDFTVPLSEL